MDPNTLENLLNEDESNYIDFKQAQYRFAGASDEDKSEILKDILAFANAWRRTDAYILIGVKEVKGGCSQVIGITDHFDDAALQQFVNSKVQKPIQFSYIAFEFEEKQVGIIEDSSSRKTILFKTKVWQIKAQCCVFTAGKFN